MLHQPPELSFITSHMPESAPNGAVESASKGRYHHKVATSVPTNIEVNAPQKLNRRQYRARIIAGPKAAPMPHTRLNTESG